MDKKILTDAYINGANPSSNFAPNANLEGGEHVRFPDGSVAEVLGDRHTKGGVDLTLPQYTQVLSDTKDLTLTKEDVKKIKKELGLDVTVKNTYSDVLDKYAKKTGYKDILLKQEELFKKADKTVFGVEDEATKAMNQRFLTQKLTELEQERVTKEQEMTYAFDLLFEKQQEQKGEPVIEPQAPTQEEVVADMDSAVNTLDVTNEVFSQEEQFKYGGQITRITELSKEKGVDARKVFDRLLKDGKLKEYNTGGNIANPPLKVDLSERQNIYKNEQRSQQSPNQQAYGSITSAESALNELYKNFPRAFRNTDLSKIATIENGKVKIKSGVSLSKVTGEISTLQDNINTYMINSSQFILDNPDMFGEKAVDYARDYRDNQTFVKNPKDVRDVDGKLGQFTSGRFSLGVNLVTPKESEKLRELGIYSVKDLAEADPSTVSFLAPETMEKVKQFSAVLPQEADFAIDTYIPQTPTPTLAPEEEKTLNEANEVKDVLQGEDLNVKQQYPRRFFTPDFGYIPPSGLTPESMQTIATARINPLRVGIEDQLKSSADARNAMNAITSDLPQAQRAALVANSLANSMSAESDAITKASQINAQNIAQADLYNANALNQENMYNNQARRDYEMRTLRGLDVTEQSFRNGMAFLHNAFQADLNRQLTMNTMDRMFPDITMDNFGIAGYYNPQRVMTPEENELMYRRVMATAQSPITTPTTTKNKKGTD